MFLDEKLNAYPDDKQWSVLASVRRIDTASVEQIATDAARGGKVVGLRIAETTGARKTRRRGRARPPGIRVFALWRARCRRGYR